MPSLPTYVSVIKSYCVGSDALGQVSNWTQHGSPSTDSHGFTYPSGVSGAGTRLLKVHNDTGTTGAVDTWWFLISFLGAQMDEWNGTGSDVGGFIYNWHNVPGDIGWGATDPNTGLKDSAPHASPVSAVAITYNSNTAQVTTLGADYNGGGTLTLATDAATLGFRTSFPEGHIGSATNQREHFRFTGISSNTLTGVTGITSGLWTAALSDSSTGSTANEVSGGSYARVAVTANTTNFPSASGGSVANGAAITFPAATATWGEVTYMGILDASSAGNLLAWADLTTSKTISSGDTASFAVGDLTVTLT